MYGEKMNINLFTHVYVSTTSDRKTQQKPFDIK